MKLNTKIACSLVILTTSIMCAQKPYLVPESIQTTEEITRLFQLNAQQLIELAKNTSDEVQQLCKTLSAIPEEQRTYANTVKKLDTIDALRRRTQQLFKVYNDIHPQEEIRKASQQALQLLLEKSHIPMHVFKAVQSYNERNADGPETLSDEQERYLASIVKITKQWEVLPRTTRNEIDKINTELAKISLEYQNTINSACPTLLLDKQALAGVDEKFLMSLPRSPEGLYSIGIDDPTRAQILTYCTVPGTRKAWYLALCNSGHPENDQRLQKIIELRNKVAQLYGYKNHADFALENSMVQNSAHAEQFLSDLYEAALPRARQELAMLQQHLPTRATLTPEGAIREEDAQYVIRNYRKNMCAIDENKLAEYFSFEKTIPAIFMLLEELFQITITRLEIPGLWHPDVLAFSIKKDTQLCGYFLFDPHPRKNKFSSAATLPFLMSGKDRIGLAILSTQLPKPIANKPALLHCSDVRTLFHELGHLLHNLLSQSEIYTFAGTHVQRDFLETPSTVLELLFTQKEVLQRISSHYQSGQPLSENEVENLLTAFKGEHLHILSQIVFARFSLEAGKEGAEKDPHILFQQLTAKTSLWALDSQNFHESSFILSHITPFYYGYLWSAAIARNIIQTIKQEGLLNPRIWGRYCDEVLSKGGSADPALLVANFLGRPIDYQAIIR